MENKKNFVISERIIDLLACVANNPHTPSSILFKLKKDDADSVKYTAEKALSERKSSKYDIDR